MDEPGGQANDTLAEMTLPTAARLRRWLSVGLIAVVVVAPRWDPFGDPHDGVQRQDLGAARMLAPSFDEALRATQMARVWAKWSLPESLKKPARPSPLVAGVAALFVFLAWTSYVSVHAGRRVRLRRVSLGRLGSRSPPHLQPA